MWKSTETVILCSQPVVITLCCQSLFTGGQSRGAHGLSAKSQSAPPTEQQLEVFESEPEKCTSEFKSAFLNLIYHQSIKKMFIFYLFFKCAIQISSMYKFTISTKLGYKTPCQFACPKGLALRTQMGIISLADPLRNFQSQCLSSSLWFHSMLEITRVSNPRLFSI